MLAVLSAILDFFKLIVLRVQSLAIMHFVALKMIMVTLVITILPIVLNNFLYDIVQIIINLINSVQLPIQSVQNTSFSGLAGYLLEKLKIIDAFSIILSCVIYRFTLKLITLGRI